MDSELLRKLSAISEEESAILRGEKQIDRTLYMDAGRDVITGSKLLSPGKIITIRPHTRFVAFPEATTMWKWCICAAVKRFTG